MFRVDRSGNATVIHPFAYFEGDGIGPTGVVQGSDGSIVAIPPGVLGSDTTVSIAPKTQADLPQAIPDGLNFAGAFRWADKLATVRRVYEVVVGSRR